MKQDVLPVEYLTAHRARVHALTLDAREATVCSTHGIVYNLASQFSQFLPCLFSYKSCQSAHSHIDSPFTPFRIYESIVNFLNSST